MKKLILILLAVILSISVFPQDLFYAKSVVQKLCSPDMNGRGLVSGGDRKAAYYITSEFEKFGLLAFDTMLDGYKQPQKQFNQYFKIKGNTFPEKVSLVLDGKNTLVPGEDFMISPSSGDTRNKLLDIVYLTKDDIKDEKKFDLFLYKDYVGKCLVIDRDEFDKMKDIKLNEFYIRVLANEQKADAMIFLETSKKLTWGFSSTFEKYPTVYILKSKLPTSAKRMELIVEKKVYYDYETQNVIGYVKGKKYPDKYIVIGAHYDHLGMMGAKALFPGANDNASGVALMMDIARFYAKPENQPDFTMLFIAFGSEEAGLAGSRYFVEHPKVPLTDIRFMINLDLLGTGEKGMMVVNAPDYPKEYNLLKSINTSQKYVADVQSRPAAPISDHAPFYQKGVSCFYFYLMGEYPYYHDTNDKFEKLSFAGYEGTYKLITDFVKALQPK
jgi:aminopeptidase YwaD